VLPLQKPVQLKAGEKLDPITGKPHRCKEDAYDLPEHKGVHLFIPKTGRFKRARA